MPAAILARPGRMRPGYGGWLLRRSSPGIRRYAMVKLPYGFRPCGNASRPLDAGSLPSSGRTRRGASQDAVRSGRPSLPLSRCAAACFALAAAAPAADTVLPEVSVGADRVASKEQRYPDLQEDNPINPYRVAPSSRLAVQKLTAKDIDDLKPTDVFDLLNHAVGVLTLYQGRKIPYSVRIRGDINFGYIIDGVYVPSEAGARILQNLPVSVIEQVEVVRDSTALTLAPMVDFGRPSGAPNDGFIIIRTRRPMAKEATSIARVESFDTKLANVYAGYAADHAYLSGMYQHFETEGRANQYMAKDSDSGLIRIGGDGAGLRADFSAFHDNTSQQIQAGDPYETLLGLQRWQLAPIQTTFWGATLSGQWRGFWDEEHTTTVTASGFDVDANQINGTVLPGVAPRLIDNLEYLLGFDFKHTLRFSDTLLRFGGQHMHWDTPTGASYYEGYPREEYIQGGFLTLEQGFFERKLIVDLAGRLDDQYIVQSVDHYYADPMRYQLPIIRDRDLPASRFATLGAAIEPVPGVHFNTRLYYAKQGAVQSVLPIPDTELHPEGQKKAEAGVSYEHWRAFQPALTAFYVHIDNVKYPALSVRDREGIVYSLWNETDINRLGFELVVNGQFRWSLGQTRYRLGWTHVSGDTTTEDYGRTTPPNFWNLLIEHASGPWLANFSVVRVEQFYSDWKAVDGRLRPIGDFMRIDLNVGRKFALGSAITRLSLYGRNLLGQRYETQLGFRDPGTVLGAELRIDL